MIDNILYLLFTVLCFFSLFLLLLCLFLVKMQVNNSQVAYNTRILLEEAAAAEFSRISSILIPAEEVIRVEEDRVTER